MESKHVCKFCKKSFPCGRSLGGHIRSHLIRGNGNASNKEPKLLKSGSGPGYELRENPKKTNKATDLNFMTSSLSSETEDGSGSDPNLARRSGLIGGNNSNSSVSEVVEPEEEEVAVAMSLIMLSRDVGKSGDISSFAAEFSDNISLLQANNNKVKKKRREKIQGKSSVPGADSKNDSKKSENLEVSASGHLQNGSKVKEFEVSANGYASNDQSNKTHESKNSVFSANDGTSGEGREKMEVAASGHLQIGLKLKESEVSENGFASNDQIMKPPRRKRKVTNPNSMSKKMSFTTFGQVKNGSKMKEFEVSENGSASNDQNNNQAELGFDDIGIGSEFLSNNSDKRSKFECNTCNKVFYSYQALGGHRASHKKLNGMIKPSPPLKLESNDRDFLSPPPSNDHHHHQQQQLLGEIGIGLSSSSSTSMKVAQKHECPICFRIFPSGQALGGHKRSHLLAANTSTNTTTNDTNKDSNVVGKSSSSEMREFLDLNLPPATPEEEEEEATIPTSSSSNNVVGLIKPYWWVESHKHELLLGLISN